MLEKSKSIQTIRKERGFDQMLAIKWGILAMTA